MESISEETTLVPHDRIVSDPGTLSGKPRVRNTRLGVDFLRAVFAFATDTPKP
jgi:uncharacterized protein (DUF433 family)